MPRLRLGHPLWLDQPAGRKQFRFSQYQQQIHADVIIVGGGITGAIAAYVFADAGLSVALLEAKRIGRGSTAASTALLMQEPDKDFRELARVYGTKDSRRIWRIVGRATRDLIALIRRLSIPCDLRSADSIYYTIDPDGVADLRKEFEARRAAGLPGRWLSDVSTMRRTGSRPRQEFSRGAMGRSIPTAHASASSSTRFARVPAFSSTRQCAGYTSDPAASRSKRRTGLCTPAASS
jgi:FAD dependent oxidoreductase